MGGGGGGGGARGSTPTLYEDMRKESQTRIDE